MSDKFHLYIDEAGEHRWRRVAPNGEVVADSGEGYEHKADAINAAIREADDNAEVVED